MDTRFIGFALIVLALDLWAILKIAHGQGTGTAKTAWILIILFLPVLGLVVWALLGSDVRKPKMYDKEPP
jgi:hypothetical protein